MALLAFRRLALGLLTCLGITAFTFALAQSLPGDPVEVMFGERGITPERHQALLAALGYDRPLALRYLIYLRRVLAGDFGDSLSTHEGVAGEFLARFPATVELATAAILIAVLLGIGIGVLAAQFRGRLPDRMLMNLSLAGYSIPIFWWAIILIMLFSLNLGLTPVSGRIDVLYSVPPVTGFLLLDCLLAGDPEAFQSAAAHLVLPAIALATVPTAVIARMTRSAMLEVLGEDFVRTARAKGAGRVRILLVHALRNALVPVLTIVGLQTGALFGGAVLTETIFAWPGVGSWLVDAVHRRDYPVVQGGLLLIAAVVVLVNLAVDGLTGLIDPRRSEA